MVLLEDLFWLVVVMVVSQMIMRMWRGATSGASRGGAARPQNGPTEPARSVHMERDPVCGTYVVPERSISVDDGAGRVYFCSATCRDKYRARTA